MKKYVFRLPYLPILLVPLILLSPVLFTGKALFWGTPALQFHPWRVHALQMLLAGELPLWNPLVGMGAPLLANYQSALLYPPTWSLLLIGAVFGDIAMAWAQGLLVVLHWMLAGWGMTRLVQELGLGTLAQTVGGLAFALSGYVVARAGFLSINAAVAWLPWILWMAYRIVQAPSLRNTALLAFFIAMQLLAGHAQTTWYTLVLCGFWVIFWGFAYSQSDETPIVEKAKTLGGFLVAGGWAGAMSAAQLLPTAELLATSQRASGADFEFAMTYSFWPWRVITAFIPNFFGNPVHGNYWGYANFWEDAVYVGLLPLWFGLSALWGWRKHDRKPLLGFLGAVLVVTFMLALGRNTPVFPWLYRNIPTFDLFQAPTRWMLLAVFAFSLLAALGVEGWRAPIGPKARARVMRRIVVSAGIVIAATAASTFLSGDVRTVVWPTAWVGLLGIGVGILTLTAPRAAAREQIGRWHIAVTVFVALDLLVAGWGLNPGIELDFYQPNVVESADTYVFPEEDLRAVMFDQYFRFDSFLVDYAGLRESALPNLGLLDGISTANNFDPLVPGPYAAWMDALNGADSAGFARLLNQMPVSVVKHMDGDEKVTPAPLASWYACATHVENADLALDDILSGAATPQRVLLVEAAVDAPFENCTMAQPIAFTQVNSRQIDFAVNASSDGWLLWRRVWYPGWRATLDGIDTEIVQANALFQAVFVPADTQAVTFRYQPQSFSVGVMVSMAGWLIWLGVMVYEKRKN